MSKSRLRPFLERRLPRTISARLSWLFVVMALLFVAVVSGVIGWTFRQHFQQTVRPHLVQYLEYVQADIGNPPNPDRAREIAQRLPVEIFAQGPSINWSTSGHTVDVGAIKAHRHFDINGVPNFTGELGGREYLVARYPDYMLVFSIPHPRRDAHARWIVPALILALLFFVFYRAARYLIAPVVTLKTGVSRIGAGDLDHRIVTPRQDELGELAVSINTMADDIQKMLEAKRQLLLAISHELRSPITRAKVSAAMVDDDRQRQQLEQDLVELERLIEELLEAERLNAKHSGLQKTQSSLSRLLEETVATYRGAGVTLSKQVTDDTCSVDPFRIQMLLRNLIENALRHAAGAQPAPRVSLTADERYFTVAVQDAGPGIEARHLPYLTEPFYRVDPARRRETGGYGLGLYLCRLIAEAHGGDLTINSEAGNGTRVTLRLPRA